MAVEVAPPSVTYPSDLTSWQGRLAGCRGELTELVGLHCCRCRLFRLKKNHTPLHPRICNMQEALSSRQWTVVAWSWRMPTSDTAVTSPGPPMRVCIVTTFPPVLLPRWLCWASQWVFFLGERSAVPGHSCRSCGGAPPIYGSLQATATFCLPHLHPPRASSAAMMGKQLAAEMAATSEGTLTVGSAAGPSPGIVILARCFSHLEICSAGRRREPRVVSFARWVGF